MKRIQFIAAALHGLLLTANVTLAVILNEHYPSEDGPGIGGNFGLATGFATFISWGITALAYDSANDDSVRATGAAVQTALLSGMFVAWVYWLMQIEVI